MAQVRTFSWSRQRFETVEVPDPPADTKKTTDAKQKK